MSDNTSGSKWSVRLDAIRQALLDEDPIEIVFEDIENFDEYDDEVREIANLLEISTSEEDLTDRLWRVFIRSFSDEIAGPRDRYRALGRRLWSMAPRASLPDRG